MTTSPFRVERAIQVALVAWIADSYPTIKVAANFNEHARQHKDTGMDTGSPDLLLTHRRGNITHMLYLELKTKKGRLSKPQIAWNEDFDAHHESSNCKRAVAYGFAEARRTIGDFYQAV